MIEKTGIITHDETWEGEILVTGDVIVPQGVSVTLGPGCRVRFAPHADHNDPGKRIYLKKMRQRFRPSLSLEPDDQCWIIVNGSLQAHGSDAQPIEIGNPGWDGSLLFFTTETNRLSGCRISHGLCGIVQYEAESRLTVSGCAVSDNTVGIVSYGDIQVEDTAISGNEVGIVCRSMGRVLISRTTFRGNRGRAVECGECSPLLAGNRIEGGDTGIRLVSCEAAIIEENEIVGCRVGIRASGGSRVKISGTEIRAQRLGIRFREQSGGAVEGGTISGNADRSTIGIETEGIAEVELKGTKITGVLNGLRCNEESQVKATDVSIESSSGAIEAGGMSGVAVAGGSMKSESNACLRFRATSSGEVTESLLEGDRGIEASEDSRVKVSGTRIDLRLPGQGDGATGAGTTARTGSGDRAGVITTGTAEVLFDDNSIDQSV